MGAMPITDQHLEYAAALPVWLRHRDVLRGEDAVKARGQVYLARLDGMSDEDYRAYVQRACFFNATARTAAGMVGMIFRRDARTSIDEKAINLADVDLAGTSFTNYAKELVSEVVATGRCGTLVDWSDSEQRPYLSLYSAESILNWRTERIDGRTRLTLVVLSEPQYVTKADGFGCETVETYRVLRLLPSGVHTVELWQREPLGSKDGKFAVVATFEPKRAGKPLTEIPFIFHGPETCGPEVERSPLEDIVSVNLDHYRLDADYKHGVHYTALPTAWVCGFAPNSEMIIGQKTAWVSEQLGASAGFLEFTGKGLTTFQVAQEHDERLMAVLGARVLFSQKKVAESAEAMAMRMVGEDSILATLARACSAGLTEALRWCVWWHDAGLASLADVPPDRAKVDLNTDFTETGLGAKEIIAVVSAWQAGAISTEEMRDIFERGELLTLTRTKTNADCGLRNADLKPQPKNYA